MTCMVQWIGLRDNCTGKAPDLMGKYVVSCRCSLPIHWMVTTGDPPWLEKPTVDREIARVLQFSDTIFTGALKSSSEKTWNCQNLTMRLNRCLNICHIQFAPRRCNTSLNIIWKLSDHTVTLDVPNQMSNEVSELIWHVRSVDMSEWIRVSTCDLCVECLYCAGDHRKQFWACWSYLALPENSALSSPIDYHHLPCSIAFVRQFPSNFKTHPKLIGG